MSARPVPDRNGFYVWVIVLDSSVEAPCLEPIAEGSPSLTIFESYMPGPGTMFLFFESLQLGTLLMKIELLPVALNYFWSTGAEGSYFPGPGMSRGGNSFSRLFTGSNNVRFALLAAKLFSGATCLCAS